METQPAETKDGGEPAIKPVVGTLAGEPDGLTTDEIVERVDEDPLRARKRVRILDRNGVIYPDRVGDLENAVWRATLPGRAAG